MSRDAPAKPPTSGLGTPRGGVVKLTFSPSRKHPGVVWCIPETSVEIVKFRPSEHYLQFNTRTLELTITDRLPKEPPPPPPEGSTGP